MGLPSRPRSELERSAVIAALKASLDFHTAVHGYSATVDIVSCVLPESEPPTPPPEVRRESVFAVATSSRPLPPPRQGPSWADMSSDSEE